MNNYAGLATIKSDIGITGASDDAKLLRLGPAVARDIDQVTGHAFYSQIATRYFNGNGLPEMWLAQDLLSVTTLKVDSNGDGTFDTTLTESTDFRLWPYNTTPYRKIEIMPASTVLNAFPAAVYRIEIAGEWGYSNETEAAGTINGALSDTTGTAVTMTAGHSVQAGDTIKIGSEQLYVSAISVDTLTVVRGVNGTTAATHIDTTAVVRRRYPRDIEQAFLFQITRWHREQQVGYATALGDDVAVPYSGLYPATVKILRNRMGAELVTF